MKTILITGVAGFIGSHLSDYFLEKNYRVIGIDNFLTGSKKNMQNSLINDNYNFIEHDVCEKINIDKEIDYILHFASPASPVDYLKYPIRTMKTGSLGTQNVLDLALEKNATILVASTSEIYGDPLEHPQNERYFGNVNTIGPRGVYDEGKRYMEALTYAYKNKFNLNVRICRIFNTYGPRMRKNDGRVIPNFLNQSIEKKDFTIYGNGNQTRSFCYIDDLVVGIDKLINSKYNMPINLGCDDEYTMLELIDLIKKINPSESKLSFFNLPENDPKRRKPDLSLARKVLNFKNKIKLEEGLIKTIDYFKIKT